MLKQRGQLKALAVTPHMCYFNNKNPVVINNSIFFLKGSTETVQVLRTLLYKAAECGAQLFIKMILNSSAGRVIFHEYKDSVPLPEVIARNHGHENTALYLEEINARLVAHTAVYYCRTTFLPSFCFCCETNYTLKPLFRGHSWDRRKCPLSRGWDGVC